MEKARYKLYFDEMGIVARADSIDTLIRYARNFDEFEGKMHILERLPGQNGEYYYKVIQTL